MEKIINQNYVLVTGGSGGIGSEVCKLLYESGINPIICFNNNEKSAKKLASELLGFAIKMDFSNNESVFSGIKYIEDNLGESDKILGVILGASPPPDIDALSNLTADQFLHQIQVNVLGVQILLKGLTNKFLRKEKKGTIVGILSEAIGLNGNLPAKNMGSYVVAKSALSSLLSVYQSEYPWLKVRKINPSYTKTKMLDIFDSRFVEILDSKNKIASPKVVAKLIVQSFMS
jgi:NAD(P)-dependent dehydrogenase (short-subunit alcohol dehydrogenase family)